MMRTIGLDLATKGQHRASLGDANGKLIRRNLRVKTRASALDQLFSQARGGPDGKEPLRLMLEPTGMSWHAVCVYAQKQGVEPYLVPTPKVHDLREYYKKHYKSDQVDSIVLVKIPFVDEETIHPVRLPNADQLAGQRFLKQLDRLTSLAAACKNRIRETDRAFWLGPLEAIFSATDYLGPLGRAFRRCWYNPWRVQQAGTSGLQAFLNRVANGQYDPELPDQLYEAAQQVIALYSDPTGPTSPYLDFDALQEELGVELDLLEMYEAQIAQAVQRVRRLSAKLHPSHNLQTIPGVGFMTEATAVFCVVDPERFSQRTFRGFHGLIPGAKQSSEGESKGVHITKAGPALLKKYLFLAASVARQWDVDLARIYYEQMVHKGKHHNQAICACATHLGDRILTILQEDRPYQRRDEAGSPITASEARTIIETHYTVPEEVRKRKTRQARKEREQRRAANKKKRESRPRHTRLAEPPQLGADFPSPPAPSLYLPGNSLSTMVEEKNDALQPLNGDP
jgi:transposase